jgi:hypothetical protein
VFLVSTAGRDVEGNLRKNLRRHSKCDRGERLTIVGTSQAITPARRRKLAAIAEDTGYQLHNVYDQTWFANRLYRDSRWRKELLGIEGVPIALSLLPLGGREGLGGTLVGRESELARLAEEAGDAVVVGQPGSGKTSVLHALTERGARFVVSDNLTKIADECRAERPPVLLVDDVITGTPFDAAFLLRLRHLRQSIGGTFRIVASCWPKEERAVADALALDQSGTLTLERLTREQIVKLASAMGLQESDARINLVVNQAEGHPGLARLLVEAAMSDKVKGLYSGELLAERTYLTVERLVGDEARYVLAVLALSGDAGLSDEAARGLLHVSIPEYGACLTKLAAGGVIRECTHGYEKNMAVFPEMLRWIIVRDNFFGDRGAISYRKVVEAVTDEVEATKTLIGAHSRGAQIPDLAERVSRLDRADLWKRYAWTGPEEAAYVFAHNRRVLVDAVAPALMHVPEMILPRLLDAALIDDRPRNAHPRHPFQQIQDWIESPRPWRNDFAAPRRMLLKVLTSWNCREKGRAAIAMQALCLTLSPEVRGSEYAPGTKTRLNVYDCLVGVASLRALKELLPRVVRAIKDLPRTSWEPVFDMLHRWAHPIPGQRETPESVKAREAFLEAAFSELAKVSLERPGIQRRLAREAHIQGIAPVGFSFDPDYEALFPPVDPSAIECGNLMPLAQAFADRHGSASPDAYASLIASLEGEAAIAPHIGPRLVSAAGALLAKRAENVSTWVRALMKAGCSDEAVAPFLARAVEQRADGVDLLLSECLSTKAYVRNALAIVLTRPAPSAALLEQAIGIAPAHVDVISSISFGHVSEAVLKPLLDHQDSRLLAAVVGAVWHARSDGEIRPDVVERWVAAVLRIEWSYPLKEILSSDPALAQRWILGRLSHAAPSAMSFRAEELIQEVAPGLTKDVRALLLNAATRGRPLMGETLSALICDDDDLCRAFFAREDLSHAHLNLLEGQPDSRWVGRAEAALAAGYSPREVAGATVLGTIHYKGSKSDFWGSRRDQYRDLLKDAGESLQEVLLEAIRLAEARFLKAGEEERREAIFGD